MSVHRIAPHCSWSSSAPWNSQWLFVWGTLRGALGWRASAAEMRNKSCPIVTFETERKGGFEFKHMLPFTDENLARLIRAARDVPQHYRGVWLRQPSRSTRRRDVRRSEALAFSLRRFLSGTTSRRAANRNFPGSNSYFDGGQRPAARSSALWAR